MTKAKRRGRPRKISRDKKMPTFVIELWNPELYKDDELPPQHIKRMWAGRIEFVKTGESVFFRQVSDMLKFIEDRRGC